MKRSVIIYKRLLLLTNKIIEFLSKAQETKIAKEDKEFLKSLLSDFYEVNSAISGKLKE